MPIQRRYRLTKKPIKYNLQGGSTVQSHSKSKDKDIIITDDKDKRCSPTSMFKDGSCMSLNLLKEMAKAYNQKFPNKIDIPTYSDNEITLDAEKCDKQCKKNLLKQFSTRLSDVCDNQRCWLKQDFIKTIGGKMKEELENTFRPNGPKGKFEWLNTLNINDVMSQYEQKYPEYKFMGAVPVDFDELPDLGIKNLNYNKLAKEGTTKLGIVFNLDEHNQPGSHWVAGYTDLDKGQVYYFDSYGVGPEPRISNYLKRCAHNCKKVGGAKSVKDIDIRFNKIRHQRGDNACGVYSINFILRILKGETFDFITENITSDDEVNKCREVYFT